MEALVLASWVMSASTSSTVIVGLNGALQKRFVLPETVPSLIPGNVHRAQSVQVGVGGKGQDVAISLACLRFPNIRLAQFVGSGPEGDLVLSLLEERLGFETPKAATASIDSLTVRPKSTMRTCTTIVASNESTELVEPSGLVSDQDRQDFFDKLQSASKTTTVGALCFMGSMPPGCPSHMYADIYQHLCSSSSSSTDNQETLCLIDSVAGLEALLATIANHPNRGPAVLKVNASELCRLAGVTKSTTESGGISPDELVQGVTEFFHKFAPHASNSLAGIAVTDGRHPAHFVSILSDNNQFEIVQLAVPDLSSSGVLYPIGAGDSVAAGTLAAWKCLNDDNKADDYLDEQLMQVLKERLQASGGEVAAMSTAFGFGLACGSASCLCEENSVFEPSDVLRFFSTAEIPRKIATRTY